MDRIVPISEARTHLTALLEEARDHEVYLIKHGKPVGVLLDAEKYERLLDRIEDLEDELALASPSDAVPFVRSTPSTARVTVTTH